MRERKFRARHKESGTWDYGSSETKLEDASSVPLCTFWEWVQIGKLDPETVGDFIGLKDKKGKEVYEGDIVEYTADKPCQCHPSHVITQVYWNDKEAGFTTMDWAIFYDLSEIIGNIYENPELVT